MGTDTEVHLYAGTTTKPQPTMVRSEEHTSYAPRSHLPLLAVGTQESLLVFPVKPSLKSAVHQGRASQAHSSEDRPGSQMLAGSRSHPGPEACMSRGGQARDWDLVVNSTLGDQSLVQPTGSVWRVGLPQHHLQAHSRVLTMGSIKSRKGRRRTPTQPPVWMTEMPTSFPPSLGFSFENVRLHHRTIQSSCD